MTHVLLLVTAIVWVVALWGWIQVIRTQGLVSKFRYLIQTTIVTAISFLLSSFLVVLYAFHSFAGETYVGQVTTKPVSPLEFDLVYHAANTPDLEAVHARLNGNQWMISGGIVKWHPWLTMLGLKNYHKPMKLSGHVSRPGVLKETAMIEAPIAPGIDWFWEALYRADPYLPFVEAVYGTAAYAYVEPGVTQYVYITPSGYLIKRTKPAAAVLTP